MGIYECVARSFFISIIQPTKNQLNGLYTPRIALAGNNGAP